MTLPLTILILILQTSPVVKQLHEYINKYREDRYIPVPQEIFEDDKSQMDLMEALSEYIADTIPDIRLKVYNLADRIGEHSDDQQVRNLAVNLLTGGLRDADVGIVGVVSSKLLTYKKSDFSAQNSNLIASLVTSSTPYLGNILKLAGHLELEVTEQLRILVSDGQLSNQYRFQAELALARRGDEQSINHITNRLNSIEINDRFVYSMVPQLVYTRQKPIIDFLVEVIQSDELNCYSANPNSDGKILCGYRVMEYLTPVIVDFPIPLDEFGEPDIKDYRAALEEVREWFDMHPDYEIRVGDI
ncbi:MAG: hypothetical protein KI791_02975 [Cyclobacteriaceae bacterium]|nr:hypothetical protein [Cyclobacteriaceae bacterium SS2]